MKKLLATVLLGTFLLGSTAVFPLSTDAATQKFSNCKELNKVYAGGVAKDSKVKNKGGKTKYQSTVSAEVYKLNVKSNRDNDGVACER